MVRVILVRHGETDLNRMLRYSGQQDAPLTALGVAQEERLCAALVTTPVQGVVSSDLPHTVRLAGQIAALHGCPVQSDPALREASFGAWEGLTYQEALARDRAAMIAFNRGAIDAAPPGGECIETLERRVRACVDGVVRAHRHQEGVLVLVSHGGALRALICSLLHLPLARHWTLRIDHASRTVLDLYPMGPIVEVLNDTCHLQGLC